MSLVAVRSLSVAAVLVCIASRAPAQPRELRIEAAGGAFVPTRSLGVAGPGEGKLDALPAASLSLVAQAGSLWLARLTVMRTIGGGVTVRPDPSCGATCVVAHADRGRVTAGALDFGVAVGRTVTVSAAGGVGIRYLDFGPPVTITEPTLPGTTDVRAFTDHSTTALAFHLRADIGSDLGSGLGWRLAVEDYVSRRRLPKTQHDLLITLGLRFSLRSSGHGEG
ncbi:MAG: hypothetical protein R2909_12235 [Gemmatimonadales bacterium]